MARKPNWKRLGLPRAQTNADRLAAKKSQELEHTIAGLPPELREVARQNPGLINEGKSPCLSPSLQLLAPEPGGAAIARATQTPYPILICAKESQADGRSDATLDHEPEGRKRQIRVPRWVYHGTLKEKIPAMLWSWRITPRGDHAGNWRAFFGGNPSHPDWTYAAFEVGVARDIAREAAGGKPVGVLRCSPRWTRVRFDEDFICAAVNDPTGLPEAFIQRMWEIFGTRLTGGEAKVEAKAARKIWEEVTKEGLGDQEDLVLAVKMRDLAEAVSLQMRAPAVCRLIRYHAATMAFADSLMTTEAVE